MINFKNAIYDFLYIRSVCFQDSSRPPVNCLRVKGTGDSGDKNGIPRQDLREIDGKRLIFYYGFYAYGLGTHTNDSGLLREKTDRIAAFERRAFAFTRARLQAVRTLSHV
jgi:hypothetical protein